MSVKAIQFEKQVFINKCLKPITLIDRVKRSSHLIFTSSLFWASLLGSVSIVSCVIAFPVSNPLFMVLSVISTIFFALFLASNKKDILYELSMIFLLVREKCGFNWWNHIDNGIYVSAIPLESKGHLNTIINDLKIRAVVTFLESFEMEKETLLTNPVRKKDWEKRGIDHLLIETEDLNPVSIEGLEKSTRFIREKQVLNQPVMFHCKVGRGRSVMASCCYFMRYKNMNPHEAIEFVTKKRSSWLTQGQVRQIHKFYEEVVKREPNGISNSVLV